MALVQFTCTASVRVINLLPTPIIMALFPSITGAPVLSIMVHSFPQRVRVRDEIQGRGGAGGVLCTPPPERS